MKDQASLNLKIVDTPIDSKALAGHLMLRATSTGLKVYDNTGVETPIGGEVDESRLLPTGAKDGDLLIKSAEIVGNDYNDNHTVLFIQGSAANAAAADSPLPVTWNNQPAVQEDNTLLLTGSTQLSTASAPEVKRVFGGEFTVEAYLKPTQFNNTSRQDTNFFYLNGPSTYYIYLSNYNNSGNAENGKFGLWVYSGNRQITLNNGEFHHVALDVYMEGSTRKYTIYYDGVAVQTDTWYNDGVADSTNAIIRFFSSSGEAELNNCYLKSIRVSDIARYKGKSFTPPANGLYLPAPDGEWITINKSQLVAQDDVKLNPDPVKVPAGKYGFSPALRNVDLVNGDTTKLYINPNLSGKEIKDIAAGTSTPHTFVNHNVTVSESTGAMVFDGSSSYLEIDPSDIITEGQEWCLDLYLKTTRYNSKIMNIRTWTDSGQEFSIWIRSSGEISVHSSPLGTGVVGKAIPLNEEFRFTLEQYIENSVWKLAMYVNGEHFGTVDAELHRYHSNTVLGKGYNDPWMSGEISRVIWRTEAPYKGTNFTDEAATELSYVMPNKVSDVPAGSTVQLNNNGTPVYVEAEKVLLSDAKSTKLNQLDVTRQLPASSADNVTPVYKKQDVIGAMYNDSKVVVLLQGSKVNIAKNAAFQLTGGDEVTVDSDGNLVFNRGNGIIVPAGKFNNENNGQFTVDIMVAVDQLPSSTGSYEYILGNDNSPTYPFNYRVFGDGTVRFQYQNTSHHIQIEQGIFTLLSFDYDGTTLRSYKDGVLVGAQDMTYSAFPNSIGIGTDQYYSHTGFAGRIKYIRMSNIARYRGQAFTAPGLAGYVTPPDGEWVTTPAIGDNRLLPNNPTNGDIPVYTNDFDRSNFNTTDTVCLLQNAGVNQFENVAKGKIGGSRISNYAGSVTIDENGYFVYPGGSGTWIEFIDSGWNANGTGDWTLDVRMIAEATGSSQYFLGPANDGSGDPQAVIRGSGTTGTIRPYEISDMIHDITFGEEFTYSMAWEAATKTLRTWKDGKQMRKKTFTSNGYQFGFKGATEFWLGRNAVDPGLKGKVKYWRLSNAALYGDNEFTPPTDVYQDAPDGAWELVNKSELGGGGISEITVGAGLSGTGTTSDPINLNIANYTSQSTISLSSTEGSVNLTGYNSVNLQETFGNKLTLAERGIVITTASGADVLLNEHASNSPSGFVILDSTGKLPAVDGSQLTNLPAGTVDLSAYTGGINLNSTNDSAVAIKFNSGNPTYNAGLSMSPAGVTLSGYGDVSLEHTGGSYLRLTSGEATLSSNASLTLSAGSRLTINASEGIYLGAAGLNTAGGLVKVGDDGKIPSSLYDAGTGGGSGIDWSNVNAELISFSADREMGFSSYGGISISGGGLLINTSSINFGEVGGTVITFDLSTLDDLKIFHADTATTSTPNTAGGFAIVGLDGKLPASILPESSGGDTSALETRVTTLETTVGTLNTTVDEILADYGEGSGALVYRVVASATEPTNPTEGMLWIKTA